MQGISYRTIYVHSNSPNKVSIQKLDIFFFLSIFEGIVSSRSDTHMHKQNNSDFETQFQLLTFSHILKTKFKYLHKHTRHRRKNVSLDTLYYPLNSCANTAPYTHILFSCIISIFFNTLLLAMYSPCIHTLHTKTITKIVITIIM